MTAEHPDPRALAEALERIDRKLPAGPWELWTSCSYRRVRGPLGKGDVLSAYNQRSDNHPDLSMPEDQLHELVALRNALPAIRNALASQPPAVQGWRPINEHDGSGTPVLIWSPEYEETTGVGVQAREDTMSGELCFAGQNARIPVRAVLSFARAGYAPEAIQREYPTLSLLEITAAAALTADAEGVGGGR